jgi:hypothetical protein
VRVVSRVSSIEPTRRAVPWRTAFHVNAVRRIVDDACRRLFLTSLPM